jgi:5-methylcytosine-specific restriction enzyme A
MSGVYLSLNQGWTFFEGNYTGQDPREKIRIVSNSFRKKLNSILNDFSDEKIDLRSNYRLAKGYELGHICGRFYLKNEIPDDAELINDLRNLVGVYRELVGIVGTNYENIVKGFLSQEINKPSETEQDETEIELLEEFDKQVSPEEYKEYKEGQRKLKQHIIRERSGQVIDEAKKNFKLKNIRVYCEICGFDFEKKYGEVGKNFIEGHHKLPISEITEEYNKITSKDIALVCSNCHRILHRKRPWLTVEELKELIKE